MKYFYSTLFLFILLLPAFAQEGVAGKYKLSTSGDSSEIIQGVILTLNCNNRFVQQDTFAIGYGKWDLREGNRLLIRFDSIAYKSKTVIIKTNLTYLVKDGRIFRTNIPKKEYDKFTRETKKYLRSFDNPFRNVSSESFSVYKAKELRRYYSQLEINPCK